VWYEGEEVKAVVAAGQPRLLLLLLLLPRTCWGGCLHPAAY
jgi:hypothetical protein